MWEWESAVVRNHVVDRNIWPALVRTPLLGSIVDVPFSDCELLWLADEVNDWEPWRAPLNSEAVETVLTFPLLALDESDDDKLVVLACIVALDL